MVTKSYLQNCAKMIKWPVNLEDKFISVPVGQEDEAEDNLMVSHLKGHGFKIQLAIPDAITETKVFDPELAMKDKRPIPKEKAVEGFAKGDKFEVKSTGDRLEIIDTTGGLSLRYLNVGKANIKMPIDHMKRNLEFQTWIRF